MELKIGDKLKVIKETDGIYIEEIWIVINGNSNSITLKHPDGSKVFILNLDLLYEYFKLVGDESITDNGECRKPVEIKENDILLSLHEKLRELISKYSNTEIANRLSFDLGVLLGELHKEFYGELK